MRVEEVQPRFLDERLRTPLKLSTGEIAEITHVETRVRITTTISGAEREAQGYGAILLSDLWAYPEPTLAHARRDAIMRCVTSRIAELYQGETADNPLALFFELKQDFRRILRQVAEEFELEQDIPLMVALVCAASIDAAVHDAFGRAHGLSSYAACGREQYRYDLSHYLGPAFAGRFPADYIASAPVSPLPVVHLVGGADKLRSTEKTDDDPEDGLPVSLEEWIARDGVYCFKVKLTGTDTDADVERTIDTARIARAALAKQGQSKLYLSTDSNEQNPDPESVMAYLRKLEETAPDVYAALLYLEQPTERDLTRHRFDMTHVAALKPVLVDEGVTGIEELQLAHTLGWSGPALKTCKGHSSCLLYIAAACEWGLPYSVQDLTNPGLALIHGAGLAARCHPLMGLEYNARQFLPAARSDIQQLHPQLFQVRNGCIDPVGLDAVGLGYGEHVGF